MEVWGLGEPASCILPLISGLGWLVGLGFFGLGSGVEGLRKFRVQDSRFGVEGLR